MEPGALLCPACDSPMGSCWGDVPSSCGQCCASLQLLKGRKGHVLGTHSGPGHPGMSLPAPAGTRHSPYRDSVISVAPRVGLGIYLGQVPWLQEL